jgi:hypothetical protein
MTKWLPFTLLATVLAIALITGSAPVEQTLGTNARLVYLHGAWVWSAMITFLAAGVAGLIGLAARRQGMHEWSRALGRTALLLWITFLPQSLYLMQANWGGLFLDEARARVPLNLAIAGLLLQVGLSFFPVKLTSWANILYGAILFWVMNGLEYVLHPEAPIRASSSVRIQFTFAMLLALMVLLSFQIAYVWLKGRKREPLAVQERQFKS